MNPYFALSAVFLLGMRGVEKKLKLTTPPISEFSPEDRKNGKVSFCFSPSRQETQCDVGQNASYLVGVRYGAHGGTR